MCRTVMWCVVLFGSVKLCGGYRHRVLRKICGDRGMVKTA